MLWARVAHCALPRPGRKAAMKPAMVAPMSGKKLVPSSVVSDCGGNPLSSRRLSRRELRPKSPESIGKRGWLIVELRTVKPMMALSVTISIEYQLLDLIISQSSTAMSI